MMAAGVVFFSTNGLFVELTFGDNHPFWYNTGVWVGTSLGLGVLLFVLHRPVFPIRSVDGCSTGGRWG